MFPALIYGVRYELEDIAMRPDQETLLLEKIHAAAYKVLPCTVLCCTVLYCTVLYCTILYCTILYLQNNTLGLAKICPEENIGRISRQTLYTYLSAFHRYVGCFGGS